MLDSLKHVKTLEGSGFSRKQAESQVQVLTDVIGGSMVTKEEFRNGLSEQRKDLRLELSELREEMRLGFVAVRKEIIQSELKMTVRLGVMMAAMFGITIAILKYL